MCRFERVIAVNDAYKLFPDAAVCYACDSSWWRHHNGCPAFHGEKWTSHGLAPLNDKSALPPHYGLNIIAGHEAPGFSTDAGVIHYGRNSGFQAVNLALLFGANPIILVGFDMRDVEGRSHFFGDHPPGLGAAHAFGEWIEYFRVAAATLPDGVEVLNATPGSALDCFPRVDLADVLARRAA